MAAGRTLAEQVDGFERNILTQELVRHRGDVRSVIETPGLPRKTFYDKMRRHRLSRNDFR
jgi:two-component system C4-dicarboxylate transport response regulator DctD